MQQQFLFKTLLVFWTFLYSNKGNIDFKLYWSQGMWKVERYKEVCGFYS